MYNNVVHNNTIVKSNPANNRNTQPGAINPNSLVQNRNSGATDPDNRRLNAPNQQRRPKPLPNRCARPLQPLRARISSQPRPRPHRTARPRRNLGRRRGQHANPTSSLRQYALDSLLRRSARLFQPPRPAVLRNLGRKPRLLRRYGQKLVLCLARKPTYSDSTARSSFCPSTGNARGSAAQNTPRLRELDQIEWSGQLRTRRSPGDRRNRRSINSLSRFQRSPGAMLLCAKSGR